MKVEIIAIGDEILIGQIIDTNSSFIAKNLNDIGIEVSQISAISDDKNQIIGSLDKSLSRSDIIIITGGLGPTKDDITKLTLSEYFNTELIHSDEVFDNIKKIFEGRNIRMNKQNLSQALVPRNCTVLNNRMGTAPGMLFRHENKMVFSLPGVPFEMKALLCEQVLPIIEKSNGKSILYNKTVYVYNIPESILAETIEDWENNLPNNLSLAYLPSPGLVKLRLTARGEDKILLMSEIENQLEYLSTIVETDSHEVSNLKVEERLKKISLEKKITISTAESCTGGLISHLITSVSGSSEYYKGSVVSYSNEIKENILKVCTKDIEQYGAVSKQVVEQMAEGVRELLNTDYSVSTSGIAGPEGGTIEKPVGTVWIAVSSKQSTISKSFRFSNNRESNIERTSVMALNMLCNSITSDE